MAQRRGGGKAGRYHAEDAFLVRVDHGDTARHETLEFNINDECSVCFSGKRQGGLADRVSGQISAGIVQTEYQQAETQP
ncbi:hypothetical protein D3C85_1727330 [compost metagenome]